MSDDLPDIELYEEWQPADDEPLPVPDADNADRYLRWLGRALKEADQIEAAFNAEISKLQARRDDLAAGPLRRAAELDELLQGYALAVRLADPTMTAVHLPHGSVSTRAGSKSIDVDEAALMEWWDDPGEANSGDRRERLPVVIVPEAKAKPSKADIKTLIQSGALIVTDDGRVIDPQTGEVVPGITQVTGDTKAKVEPA